jgi:hypothetical protein
MLWFAKVQEKTTGKMFYNVVYWKKKEKEAIQYTVYDCPFGIFKLFFVEYFILITLKVY